MFRSLDGVTVKAGTRLNLKMITVTVLLSNVFFLSSSIVESNESTGVTLQTMERVKMVIDNDCSARLGDRIVRLEWRSRGAYRLAGGESNGAGRDHRHRQRLGKPLRKKKQRILLSFLIRVRNRNLVPRAQVDDEINLPDVLHWVHVPVTSEDFCREAYDGEVIIDSMMCAGVPEGELAIFVSTSERWETLKNGGCL